MKKYSITVNGEVFQVEVEEITDASAVTAATAAARPVEAAVHADTPAAAPVAKAAAPSAGGLAINSPLPGTILSINCAVGKAVKAGDVLMVLEAMKMENDIVAPQDGTVTQICVSVGANVQTDDLLLTL